MAVQMLPNTANTPPRYPRVCSRFHGNTDATQHSQHTLHLQGYIHAVMAKLLLSFLALSAFFIHFSHFHANFLHLETYECEQHSLSKDSKQAHYSIRQSLEDLVLLGWHSLTTREEYGILES